MIDSRLSFFVVVEVGGIYFDVSIWGIGIFVWRI